MVSFTLTEEPQHIDIITSNSKEEVRSVCFLHLFTFSVCMHVRMYVFLYQIVVFSEHVHDQIKVCWTINLLY